MGVLDRSGIATGLLVLALGAGAAGALAQPIPALPLNPEGSTAPARTSPTLVHSPAGALANPRLGAALAGFELNPPGRTRGDAAGTEAERVFEARCRSVALLLAETAQGTGSGTGSIVTDSGLVLTAAHVVKGAKELLVGVFPNCRPGTRPIGYAAQVVKIDDFTDLALVQIVKPPAGLQLMPLGNVGEVRPGSTVLMIGHPQELLMSLSRGLVSAVRPQYEWRAQGDSFTRKATVIQTDGAINPGNSGGPMLSTAGNLIGVNSFGALAGGGSAGLNFAVAVSEVREFIARQGSRVAKAEPQEQPKADARQGAAASAKCEPKVVGEKREAAAKLEYIDITCSGKANAVLRLPDDASRPAELWVDRNGDGKSDVVYYLPDRKGSPAYSLWDDSFSGKLEWRGEHLKGEWEPFSKTRVAAR